MSNYFHLILFSGNIPYFMSFSYNNLNLILLNISLWLYILTQVFLENPIQSLVIISFTKALNTKFGFPYLLKMPPLVTQSSDSWIIFSIQDKYLTV